MLADKEVILTALNIKSMSFTDDEDDEDDEDVVINEEEETEGDLKDNAKAGKQLEPF